MQRWHKNLDKHRKAYCRPLDISPQKCVALTNASKKIHPLKFLVWKERQATQKSTSVSNGACIQTFLTIKNNTTKWYRRVDNRLGDKMYIKIVEHEKCLCKQAHNSTVGYNATINTSVHIFMIHGISTITVNFNIYIYKKINTKTCISVVSYLKNSSAKRTCGYRIMPLLTSRTRARVPFGQSLESHAHVHA